MSSTQESVNKVGAPPLTTPRTISLSLRRDNLKKEIEELENKVEQLQSEHAHQKTSVGGNMSSDTPSKDWVERKISEVDNKIEMDRVKSDARFEKLISDSDIKFEKLIGEMNAKFAITESKIIQVEGTHIKWMAGLVFSFIAFTLAAIGFSTNLILRAIPSPSMAQQIHNSPPSAITENPKK